MVLDASASVSISSEADKPRGLGESPSSAAAPYRAPRRARPTPPPRRSGEDEAEEDMPITGKRNGEKKN